MTKKIINTILVICISSVALGQTTNTGVLVVGSGTIFSTVEDLDNTSTGEFFNDGDSYIYANFNNNGVVDFFDGGLTRFIGFNNQDITGANRSYLYNALFSNKASDDPFHLYGTISIANESNYERGIVNNDDYKGLFIYEQNGYHIGVSDISHTDGVVLKEGNVEFSYPIGDGGYYRYTAISAPELESDGFDGKYTFENSNNIYPHNQKEAHIEFIDNTEYWVLNRTFGTSDVVVTLSWREETTPAQIYAPPQENTIRIVRWDELNNQWVDEGGIVDVDNKTVTSIVSGYGIYTLARVLDVSVSPCGLTIFNAVSANGDGKNDYFLIDNLDDSCVQNLRVKIFNRWGVKVYEADNYGVGNNVFRGYSDGRLTINEDNKLPTGTYYYILELDYPFGDNETKSYKTTGYLYLTSDKK
ncbi:conserved exported hypothetical protein [Tenacibaculum sediminilitoris]|uniref:gliding motility-associated C-terminal domain-containing protein n=1 Tax=Tenacibaculum sediminilitoris TaxID=1820334 RepID=UPI003893406B